MAVPRKRKDEVRASSKNSVKKPNTRTAKTEKPEKRSLPEKIISFKKTLRSLKASAKTSPATASPALTRLQETSAEAVSAQEILQVSPRHEFAVSPAQQIWPEQSQDLPSNYGDNHIYLLVRDPHWIYAYWEIQHDRHWQALQQLGGNWDEVKTLLRVYDTSDPKNWEIFSNVELKDVVDHWFINVHPNRSYVAEIGLLHRDGRYLMLVRSNQVTTPRAGMSDVIDEQWMDIDFDKMYALSGGFEVGKSSAELQKLMEERLRGAITSGSGAGMITSMGSPVKIKKQRGFWFVLDCELIVYGATEPDALVTLQGKTVKLRPDGTFTCRFALPDGKIVLDAKAVSADGLEERNIIPTVVRSTERPAPILKAGS
ncbi:MAG: DUF4912 domain-containing protein [Candidatus Omnitrophota bacterium]